MEIKGLCPTATIHKLATIINKILETLTISDILYGQKIQIDKVSEILNYVSKNMHFKQ